MKLIQRDFKNILEKVCFAAPNKRKLNYIFFEIDKNTLNIFATDRFLLAATSITLKDWNGEKKEGKIPIKTVKSLMKLLKKSDDLINISLENDSIEFEFEDIKLIQKYNNNDWIDYKRVLNFDYDNKIEIKRSQAINALKSARLDNFVTRLEFDGGDLEITRSVGCDLLVRLKLNYRGESVTFNFKWEQLKKIFNHIKESEVVLCFENEYKHCLIVTSSCRYAIMPIVV